MHQLAGAGSVYLHIGEPKTGTTYIQETLWTNRRRLARNGLLYPASKDSDHWAAAQDLRGIEQSPNDPFGPVRGYWERIASAARKAPTAVISHELLAAVDAEQAARAVDSLRPADVHVVLTVRDIATLLPAEWQESVKHRNTRPWHDWLSDVIDRESSAADRRTWWFWRVHDTLEILRIWSEFVNPRNIHVLPVPRGGAESDLLWRRFAQVVGVDPALADMTYVRRNTSLDLSQIEFLRRLNTALPEQIPDWLYMAAVKDGLAHEALASGATTQGQRLYLPADRDDWARDYADALVAGLRASEFDIVGDLADLRPPSLPDQRPDPSAVRDDDVAAVGIAAAVGLLAQVAEHEGVLLDQPQAAVDGKPPGALKRMLIDLSTRSRAVHRLRRVYWSAANSARRRRSRSKRTAKL